MYDLIELIHDRFAELENVRIYLYDDDKYKRINVYDNGCYICGVMIDNDIIKIFTRTRCEPFYQCDYVLSINDFTDIDEFVGLMLCKRFYDK